MRIFSFREWLNLSEAAIDEKFPFKAVIMAGGPGSGKSLVARNMFLPNFKHANSDEVLRMMAKKIGKPEVIAANVGDPDYDLKLQMNQRANQLSQDRAKAWQESYLPIVIDITGRDVTLVQKIKNSYEKIGYDVYMVFVKTNLDVAQKRNKRRAIKGSHVADPSFVGQAWQDANANIKAFKAMFGPERYREFSNDYENWPTMAAHLSRAAMGLIGGPVENPIGRRKLAEMQQKFTTTPAQQDEPQATTGTLAPGFA